MADICRDFLVGRCFRTKCKFAHTLPEGHAMMHAMQPPQQDVQQVCRDYELGRCFRTRCRYYHPPPSEMASTASPLPYDPLQLNPHATQQQICYDFLSTSTCRRMQEGSICRFRHLHPTHPEAIAERQRRLQQASAAAAAAHGHGQGVNVGVGPFGGIYQSPFGGYGLGPGNAQAFMPGMYGATALGGFLPQSLYAADAFGTGALGSLTGANGAGSNAMATGATSPTPAGGSSLAPGGAVSNGIGGSSPPQSGDFAAGSQQALFQSS
eukprot:Opistho-1_new@54476